LLSKDVTDAQIAEIYQLVRMAFYALQRSRSFSRTPVVVSLANDKNWRREIRRLHKSPAELRDSFRDATEMPNLQKNELSWQYTGALISERSLHELSHHLSAHPCL